MTGDFARTQAVPEVVFSFNVCAIDDCCEGVPFFFEPCDMAFNAGSSDLLTLLARKSTVLQLFLRTLFVALCMCCLLIHMSLPGSVHHPRSFAKLSKLPDR